ncbi:MAG TPA: hypothetical protein VI978_01830 [Candidatus Paceibacterota bacterium]
MEIFWLIVKITMGLYIATTTILLLSARLKKNSATGNLILDPNSWHFRFIHPFLVRNYDTNSIIIHRDTIHFKEKYLLSDGLCGYSFQFFLSLYIFWPILILLSCAKTILYAPFTILFGYYPIANLESMTNAFGCPSPLAVDFGKIPLPEIKGHRIFPIYVLLPSAYIVCWLVFPTQAVVLTILIVSTATLFGLVVVVDKFTNRLKNTENENVSLVKEWVSAKHKKVCPKLEIR